MLKVWISASNYKACDVYFRSEENILDSFLPLEIKAYTRNQRQFFDDELFSLKRKKRKADRKNKKAENVCVKFD